MTLCREKLVELHLPPEYDLGSELLGHSLFRKKLVKLHGAGLGNLNVSLECSCDTISLGRSWYSCTEPAWTTKCIVVDPDWIRIQWWIRIRIRNPDPDPGGQK